ncbi:MAG TPA: hypothetical protein VJ622_01630 [Acidimicrobiia bacterium]|nr:hypothetical protein [Acidimicrobiia bacterium]HMC79351.1 hypothetical protein [Acidimicrobiia bacterium]
MRPSVLSIALVRLFVLAVMVGALLFSLREWHTATVLLVFLGAAWLLGRVD